MKKFLSVFLLISLLLSKLYSQSISNLQVGYQYHYFNDWNNSLKYSTHSSFPIVNNKPLAITYLHSLKKTIYYEGELSWCSFLRGDGPTIGPATIGRQIFNLDNNFGAFFKVSRNSSISFDISIGISSRTRYESIFLYYIYNGFDKEAIETSKTYYDYGFNLKTCLIKKFGKHFNIGLSGSFRKFNKGNTDFVVGLNSGYIFTDRTKEYDKSFHSLSYNNISFKINKIFFSDWIRSKAYSQLNEFNHPYATMNNLLPGLDLFEGGISYIHHSKNNLIYNNELTINAYLNHQNFNSSSKTYVRSIINDDNDFGYSFNIFSNSIHFCPMGGISFRSRRENTGYFKSTDSLDVGLNAKFLITKRFGKHFNIGLDSGFNIYTSGPSVLSIGLRAGYFFFIHSKNEKP